MAQRLRYPLSAEKNDQPIKEDQMSVQVAYHASGAEAETLETYSLTMQNRSTQPWTFYVYQEPPATEGSFFSLAWYASPFLIMPGSRTTFEWDNSCDFV